MHPVGLFGELMRNARVFGVTAAREEQRAKGEGIEKREDNFADEIAKLTHKN